MLGWIGMHVSKAKKRKSLLVGTVQESVRAAPGSTISPVYVHSSNMCIPLWQKICGNCRAWLRMVAEVIKRRTHHLLSFGFHLQPSRWCLRFKAEGSSGYIYHEKMCLRSGLFMHSRTASDQISGL